MKIPVITVSGTPYELGYQHGRQTKEMIRKNFYFYLDLWKYFAKVERNQVLADVSKFFPYIQSMDSELIEELNGLAEASEMRFEEILALNCRFELSFAYMSPAQSKTALGGCTAFALTPEATQNRHTFIGQNWDFKPGLENSCIILRIKQEKKPDIMMHTEAGIIGHKGGVNSAGIGICGNFIRSEKDTFQLGLPLWIKIRGLLNCESLMDCMKILMNFEGPNSVNMVIAHRDGEAINVECMPDDSLFLYPEQGILVHANHFLSPSLRLKDIGKALLPDTVIRSHRAFQLFRNIRKDLNSDSIKNVMKDHFGYPNSICRHRDERLHPREQWETLTSIIVDLTEGKMLYTNGPPCFNTYESIAIE